MVLLIKKKNNSYRRFRKDIWGLCYDDDRGRYGLYRQSWYLKFFFKIFLNRIANKWKRLRRFVYRIDKIEYRYKRKKVNKRWLSLRLTRLYFLIIKDRQFRKIIKRANKMDGDMESNYYYYLECRLFPFLYRMHFARNMFVALENSKLGYIIINMKKKLTRPNSLVPLGLIIYVRRRYRFIIRHFVLKRAKIKALLFNFPRYIFISWRLWYLYILRKPRKKDIVYPISIDVQRITGYY
jgi:ribosomal protein S4